MKRVFIGFVLCLLCVLGMAQSTNRTPILRGFLQSNLDGNGFALTNVIIDGSGITNYSGQTNNTLVAGFTNVVVVTNSGAGYTLYSIGGLTDTNVVNALGSVMTNAYDIIVTNIAQALLSTNVPEYSGYATNAGFVLTSTLTNQVYASNVLGSVSEASHSTNAEISVYVSTAILTNSVYGSNVTGAVSEAFHATNADISTYAGTATNATFVLTSTITNQVYASNVVSGGVIPLGAVATNTGWNGSVLVWSNSSRVWSQDGSALTNVPFSIFTNYAAAPTEYTNVGALAFGTNLYGMTSFWTYASVPIIGTVPIFNFGIDTNTVITTNGGTFTGTILDNSVTSVAPANNQLVTANWVRGLFAGAGVSYYSTTNINNTFTNADIVTTNIAVYELNTNIPVYSRRVYTAPTNNSYIGQVVTTNTFQQLVSGVTVNAYLEAQNGSGTGGPQVKPEIYVSYDRTNWIGDWDASPQYIPEGATNLYSWVVSNPTYVSTNAGGFYVQRRFKMVTQTSPIASDVLFHLGTNRPSHITLSAADSSSGNAFLAANQTFTGTNIFSTWLAGNGGGLTNLPARSVGISIDGGGSAITAGTKGYISVPYAATIASCTIMAAPSGSIEFRIWRTNSADGSFPPTAAGAIGTNSLTSDNYNVDSTLSNWTKLINAGDVLGFNVPSAATSITNCTLQLKLQP